MAGIKQSHIKWLCGLRSNGYRLRFLAKLVRWIVDWAFAFLTTFWEVTVVPKGVRFMDKRSVSCQQSIISKQVFAFTLIFKHIYTTGAKLFSLHSVLADTHPILLQGPTAHSQSHSKTF